MLFYKWKCKKKKKKKAKQIVLFDDLKKAINMVKNETYFIGKTAKMYKILELTLLENICH